MAITLNGTTGITTPKLDALDLELGSKNVVERGSNANGEYVRFADGTQICTHFVASFSSTLDTTWVFPAEFAVSANNIAIFGGTDTSMGTTLYLLGIGNPSLTEVPLRNFAISVGGSLARSESGSRVCAIGRWY